MASYRVDVSAGARQEIRRLLGHIRQRVIRALRELEQQPRPSNSAALDLSGLDLPAPLEGEPRRIRLESWRIIYVVEAEPPAVLVLAVRKRPPYRYEDLDELLSELE